MVTAIGRVMPDGDPGSTPAPLPGTLAVLRPGTCEYTEAWEIQRQIVGLRRSDATGDVLLLLQHPHTYTLGRRGNAENILLPIEDLQARGIALHRVDRGGDVTYHGPGQLVGYPILRLPPERLDYVRYIRDVEEALLLAVQDLGVPAERKEGFSGVWVGNDKVCAIGVKIAAGGVTMHGFALNVNTDLSYFEHIVPCGLTGMGVTSLGTLLQRHVSMRRVERAVISRLAAQFNLTPRRGALRLLRPSREDAGERSTARPA